MAKLSLNLISNATKVLSDVIPYINSFMRDTTKILDKRLTIMDNIDGDIKVINLSGNFPLYLAWDRPTKPVIGILGALRRVDGTNFTLSAAVTIDWEFDNTGMIKLKGIPGLTTSSTAIYEAKILFLVG